MGPGNRDDQRQGSMRTSTPDRLVELVEAVRSWPDAVRRQWIDWLCASVFDRGRPLPLGDALLRLLLEDLSIGVRAGRLHAARWMAQLPHPLDGWGEATGLRAQAVGPAVAGVRELLLERALQLDPMDGRARLLLLAHLKAELERATADPERSKALGPQWFRDRVARVQELEGSTACGDTARWLQIADALAERVAV